MLLPAVCKKAHFTPYLTTLNIISLFLLLIFANSIGKNSTLTFCFELLSLPVRLNIFMEAHAYSKLPLEVFIFPQPCSITRRNSYLNQPLFPPSKNLFGFIKTYLDAGFYTPLDKNEWLHTWIFYVLN